MVPASQSTSGGQSDLAENAFGRYVPLLAWLIIAITLIAIPFKILSYGYLPAGDARRHVGKAFTNKQFTDILVVRPEYKMDHSPGWEGLLRFLHQKAGWSLDALVAFSVAGLMLCVFYAPLPWLRRPEAWLLALLAQTVAIPEVMTRLSQARPYLITEGVLICILFAWSRPGSKNPSWPKVALTIIGVSLSVCMHGAWYLWAVPLGAFFFACCWREFFWLTGCVGAGVICGACATGKPITFLSTALAMLGAIGKEHIEQWMLVGEFRPSYGEFDTLALVALVVVWRKLQTGVTPKFHREPVAWMILLSWILAFKADRSWADWGVPSVLVWMTMQFEELLPGLCKSGAPMRALACLLIAGPFFLHTTNDLDRRYTINSHEFFLDASDPALDGWLPEDNCIFYSAQMDFFYNTFYKNPQAKWRYILGMEPAVMPDEDLQIFRKIQWNNFAFKAYEPWVDKMKTGDRLMISSSGQPNLPRLEWRNAVGNIWIGKLPKAKT